MWTETISTMLQYLHALYQNAITYGAKFANNRSPWADPSIHVTARQNLTT